MNRLPLSTTPMKTPFQSTVPKTSESLLIAIASNPESARWAEFVKRYDPMMRAYLKAKFPGIDADDTIQETLCALMALLPSYRYAPDETGLFRSYLTGVLRNKALMVIRAEARRIRREQSAAEADEVESDGVDNAHDDEEEDRDFRHSAYELALREFFADKSVMPRTKEIFRRVALGGESPAKVAEDYGIVRNAVDQIKARSTAKIRKLAEKLEQGL